MSVCGCVCVFVCVCGCVFCVSADAQVSADTQIRAQTSAHIQAQVFRSVHRCSGQCVWCGCACLCLCVWVWVSVFVCLFVSVCVCVCCVCCVCCACCVCVVCVGVRVGVYVCLCVLRVHMSMHPALYDCQDVQHTGKQHRCKILGWVFCCVVDLNYTSGNTTTAVTLLQVNVNWLCR